MYQIESRPFGFALTFSGSISKEEMEAWVAASSEALCSAMPSFGVLVDMRSLDPLTPQAKAVMEVGQRMYKTAGMVRSAVILDSAKLAVQFKNIAWTTGIYEWERYITASQHTNWTELALNWITAGLDPDKIQINESS